MATEVEETIKRIQAHKGVMGVVIVNHEGIPIKSSLDNATSVLYAGLLGQLTEKAKNVVREMDSTNELSFLRVRSRRHEILIAPDPPRGVVDRLQGVSPHDVVRSNVYYVPANEGPVCGMPQY